MREVDMSPEAVTSRMLMLDQLWELAVSLKNSKVGPRVENAESSVYSEQKKADRTDPLPQ